MRSHRAIGGASLAAMLSVALCLPGCGGGYAARILLDPDAIGTDQGTLISLGDIRSVAQEMIQSMSSSPILSRLRAERSPLRILVGNVKQRTSIAIFDKQVFLNRLLSNLSAADATGSYTFLRRESLAREEPREAPTPTGADLVLSGELRELLHRESVEGGGERETRTVQYTLTLTRVGDAAIAWTRSQEVVKQQITGAVYR